MITPASIKGHPLHVMLIPLPLGLWIFSWVADLIYISGWGGEEWRIVGFYTLSGGVVGALLAAIPGYLDFRSLINPHSKKIGIRHMTLNLIIVALFGVNAWIRAVDPTWEAGFILSTLGVLLLAISGWLGGELVYKHGVGVDTGHVLRTTEER
ncbi:DUF2231 domain-containing protein [Candidatus Nitrospira allomarina]|uniref:DUF2231 domain-containing protein n=1 Tax=Candidatus Nitrospira allomarina TaxID=3020900 RepID=A0AA96G758_9BACT|nr:DUF2231 domain-containing protein [Candidatus Nitrospira allomarina]WNM56619.1 DUF2231 domain-containing protein [Candidatus Nitrospira allomarina]